MKVLMVGNGINRYAGIVQDLNQLFIEAVKIDGFQVKRNFYPTLEYNYTLNDSRC